MTTALVAAVAALLSALGGFLAWWVKRRDAQRDPIPRQAAELAMAEQALGIVAASRDTLVGDVARLLADRDKANGRLDVLEPEVEALRREVHTIRQAWTAWYRDLAARWEHHRQQVTPPVPPTAD